MAEQKDVYVQNGTKLHGAFTIWFQNESLQDCSRMLHCSIVVKLLINYFCGG